MYQIPVGDCIPGAKFTTWVPALLDKGFECFSANFHMTLSGLSLKEEAAKARALLDGTGIALSALGFYCNPLQNGEQERTLHEAIDMAAAYGTNLVSTFAGALEGESVEAALPRFRQVFGELTRHAEDKGVRLAIENCPMGGTWKKCTCNIGFNPRAWEMMFDAVPSDALGLEWEPAHQMYQLIDPVANLRAWVGKVFHVHAKDARVRRDLIEREGIIGAKEAVEFRFPGFGDTDWRVIFEILQESGYQGMMSIEGYHDFLYKADWEYTGQLHALKYLKWCRGDAFSPNPWDEGK